MDSPQLTSAPPASGRLMSIDFLRGVAALAVVLQHALTFGNQQAIERTWFRGLAAILDHGHLGVPLFFVISGFCIHLRWAKRHRDSGRTGIDFVSFWKRRMYRLYPSYFVVLLLSMALVAAAYLAGLTPPLVALYPFPRPQWMAIDFVVHALMLHGLHPMFDKAGGNPPFWSLAREEYLYVMYFGLLAVRRRRGMIAAAAMSLAVGLIFTTLGTHFVANDPQWRPLVQTSALTLWIQWSLGAVAVEAACGLIDLPKWCSHPVAAFAWAIAAKLSSAYVPALEPLGWGLTFFIVVNYCVRAENTGCWPQTRAFKWLSRVGTFSYSLYLVHYPVRAVLKQLMGGLAQTIDPWLYVAAMALMTIAAYWIARAFFALVESRFVNIDTARPADAGVFSRDRRSHGPAIAE